MTDYDNNCSSFVICMYACQIMHARLHACSVTSIPFLIIIIIYFFIYLFFGCLIMLLFFCIMHVRIQDYMHAI